MRVSRGAGHQATQPGDTLSEGWLGHWRRPASNGQLLPAGLAGLAGWLEAAVAQALIIAVMLLQSIIRRHHIEFILLIVSCDFLEKIIVNCYILKSNTGSKLFVFEKTLVVNCLFPKIKLVANCLIFLQTTGSKLFYFNKQTNC